MKNSIRFLFLACVLFPDCKKAEDDNSLRKKALWQEINNSAGVLANVHEIVLLFNKDSQNKFLWWKSNYLRKDIAVIDYGFPISSAQIEVKDSVLHVTIPKLKAVAVDRHISMNLDKAGYQDEAFEARLHQNLLARSKENNNYRCKIINSTTRQYFEILARKYGYTLEFKVDDPECNK